MLYRKIQDMKKKLMQKRDKVGLLKQLLKHELERSNFRYYMHVEDLFTLQIFNNVLRVVFHVFPFIHGRNNNIFRNSEHLMCDNYFLGTRLSFN